MRYSNVEKAVFLSRPNRFVAEVERDGKMETVHVKNTGRCRELLLPGATVYLAKGEGANRKTEYDLVAVEKKRESGAALLVNMDSQAPNAAVEDFLKSGKLFSTDAIIRREVFFGSSRFDFYVEDGNRRIFLEVKGVTLEEGGKASFPDAPTQRGVRHLEELVRAKEEGFEACVLFVIQMKEMHSFSPNDKTHPAFGKALRDAADRGVAILAYDCIVKPDEMVLDQPVPVKL